MTTAKRAIAELQYYKKTIERQTQVIEDLASIGQEKETNEKTRIRKTSN